MRHLFLALLTFATMVFASKATEPSGKDNARAEIEKILHEQTDAWNAGDADKFARHFADQGTFTNILGMFMSGKAAFHDRHEQIFKTVFRGTKITMNVVSIRFVRPDVAVVETI